MKIIVLGAGVVGVTSAWFLALQGFDVTVVERQPESANETSFANGGQISVSHAEPWANPHVFGLLAKWIGRPDAPLLWRWNFDLSRWAWALRFLGECSENKTRYNIAAIVNLAIFSRQQLQKLRGELNLNYDQKTRGILHLYTNSKVWKKSANAIKVMQDFGLDRKMISAEECLNLEPALKNSKLQIVGGDFTPSDESGDARKFTQLLTEQAQKIGVKFLFNHSVEKLEITKTDRFPQIAGVVIKNKKTNQNELLTADNYVVCLGSYSPQLVKPLGINLYIQPAKGYSITLELDENSQKAEISPNVSLTDDERKLVFSRLGDKRLRVAGTAEFNGFNLELNQTRCNAILQRTLEWFPHIKYVGDANFWCGLRPATPSNLPYIGKSKYQNLWLNTGHGTLGWTLSCGSAAILANLIAGKKVQAVFPNATFPFLL